MQQITCVGSVHRAIKRMPDMFQVIRAIIFALCFACIGLAHVQTARAQGGALTIGVLIQGLQDLAKQLEDGAQALLQQGNIALSQQQMIAAGSIRALANQIGEIYKDRLNDTAKVIAFAEGNLADDATKILAQAQDIEKAIANDVRTSLYQLQGSVNQLINRMPFTVRNPVFYGMLVYDVATAFPSRGYDLELLGLNLTDPKRGSRVPKIVVGGEVVPAEKVSVQEDRVQVVLPQTVKEKIGFRQSTCAPPTPFAANMTVYFRTENRFMFFPGKDIETTFNAFALAEPDAIMAKVNYSGLTHTVVDRVESFTQPGSYATVGCTDNNNGAAVANLPANATEIKCNAAWVDYANLKTQSASCAVGGSTVTASGTMRGLDLNCFVRDVFTGGIFGRLIGKTFCNCPGGGHGTLQLTGTYKVPQTSTSSFRDDSVPPYRFVENFDSSIPSDTARQIQVIDVELRRARCDNPLDMIRLQIPADATAVATQAAQNGLFKATYKNQRLTIERTR